MFYYASFYRPVFYVIPVMMLAQAYSYYKNKESYHMSLFLSSGVFEYLAITFSILWFFCRHLFSANYSVYIVDMAVVACDLYALAIGRGKISKFFASRTMVYLGNISMYIFITHYLIIYYVDLIVRWMGIGSIPVAIGEIIISLAITFWISDWLYRRDGRLAYFDHIVSFIQPRLKFAEKYFTKE